MQVQDFSGFLPPIERRFDDNPTHNPRSPTRRFGDLTCPILETILDWKIQHFALRLFIQISRSAAPATKSDTPTSPNIAPVTENESYNWSALHITRHLQCAEQPQSPCNITKYCTCHAILIRVTYKTSFTIRGITLVTVQYHQILRLPRNSDFKMSAENPSITSANLKTIRAWSEHEPKIKSSFRTRRFGSLTRPILETILYWTIQHVALRLSPKMSRNAVPATKSHIPTSANIAPGTKDAGCSSLLYSLFASIFSWQLYPLRTYSLLVFIFSWELYPLGIYFLLAFILQAFIFSWHVFSKHLFSILSWHFFSFGIYSLSMYFLCIYSLRIHCFSIYSLSIYSPSIDFLLASILQASVFYLASMPAWHLVSLGIYFLLASILSWHQFSLDIHSLSIYSPSIYFRLTYILLVGVEYRRI